MAEVISGATPTAKRKIVFIVEDDPFLLKIYEARFKGEGVEVWIATDGKEALTFLAKEPPSVVLLDLILPGVNGFEVLAALKANERWQYVPVIILSNLGQPEDVERGRALGAVEHIVKVNTDIDEVIAKVKKYL